MTPVPYASCASSASEVVHLNVGQGLWVHSEHLGLTRLNAVANGSVTLSHSLIETARELHARGQWSLATRHFRLALLTRSGAGQGPQRIVLNQAQSYVSKHRAMTAGAGPERRGAGNFDLGPRGWRIERGKLARNTSSVVQLVFMALHEPDETDERMVNQYVKQLERSVPAAGLWVLLFGDADPTPAMAWEAPVFRWCERALHQALPELAFAVGRSLRAMANEPIQNHATYYYFTASLLLWHQQLSSSYPSLRYFWRLEPDAVFTGSLAALVGLTASVTTDVLLPMVYTQKQTYNTYPHWQVNRAALQGVPPRQRVWSLVSLARYSTRFIVEMMPRRWRESGRVIYEEIGLPVTCLTTRQCSLAHFGYHSALGKRIRYSPEWRCQSFLRSREQCWHELWHPVKDRRCLVSEESQAALAACEAAALPVEELRATMRMPVIVSQYSF